MGGSDPGGSQREIPKTPKGLDLAGDLVKQVITLSTAVTAFTATFAKNFSPSVSGVSVVPWYVTFVLGVFYRSNLLWNIVFDDCSGHGQQD